MSIRSHSLLLSAVVAVIALSAWSLPAHGQGGDWKDNPIKKMLFEQYDKDNDGQLSPKERQTIKQDFDSGKLQLPPGVREMALRWLAQQQAKREGEAKRQQRAARQDKRALTQSLGKLANRVIVDRDVEYGRAGERPLKLDLVRPKTPNHEPLPVIVYIHGGAWTSGDKSTVLPALAEVAAKGDYVCASIGYRLSGEAVWPAQIHDCKAAIRWLRANAKQYTTSIQKRSAFGAHRPVAIWRACWARPAA